MEKIKIYLNKYKLPIIVISFLLITSITLLNKKEHNIEPEIYQSANEENINLNIIEEEIEENVEKDINSELIKVDIKGMVFSPGVYELIEGSRIIDIIKSAGGLRSNADTSNINLSKKITDEMVIVILSDDEVSKLVTMNNLISKNFLINNYLSKTSLDEKTENITKNKDETSTKISLNNATMEQLVTLPGIGEAKAKLIIEYRENNRFNKIEDILEVSGIGEKLYNQIKDFITI